MDWRTPGLGLRIGVHRGGGDLAPENTIAALEVAATLGADYVEVDVAWSADRVLVLFHDAELERTTDGHGPLAGRTLAELRSVDAGRGFGGRFDRVRIATLDEALAWLASHPALGATLEAKAPGTGGAIARAVRGSPVRDELSICSFKVDELRAARDVEPDLPLMLIVDRDLPDAEAVPDELVGRGLAARVDAINVAPRWATPALLAAAHRAGLTVSAGTVNEAAGIRRLVDLGVDFVDTDRPDLTLAARPA